jgi:hypothetical protein
MTFPVEGRAEEIVDSAHPVDGDSAILHGQFKVLFFSRILREKHKVVNVDANVDGFAFMFGREIGEAR